MAYKAIIAGASGLVGSALLQILLEQDTYDEVLVLVRKELLVQHKKLVQLVIDFDQLHHHKAAITGHALFCCLGSTRKKTPDLNEYKKIDVSYPTELANMAAENNIAQYHLISSIGADATAKGFYLRFKGEAERAIEAIGLRCLHIYRPSFLKGTRKEFRPVEPVVSFIMKLLDPLLIAGLKKYRSIDAKTVAMAMYKQSLIIQEGTFVHPSDHIKQLV